MVAHLTILQKQGTTTLTLKTGVSAKPGDLIGYDGTDYVLADADATTPIYPLYIATQYISAGGTGEVATWAVVYDDDAPFTKGALQYLSATAGGFTETQPTAAAGTMQRVVGRAVSTSVVVLDMGIPHYVVTFSAAANSGLADTAVFVADRPLRLIAARETHGTAGTDAGDVTLDVKKAASGTAIAGGTSMLASTFNLKGTAATPAAAAPSAIVANTKVKPGDQVGLDFTGTLTAVAGVAVTLTFVEDL